MVGHDQKVLIWSRANHCRPKGGPLGQVADRGSLRYTYALDLRIEVVSVTGEINVLPGRHRIGRNDLHRLGKLLGESGHQIGVAGHHRLHRFAEAIGIQRAAECDVELYRVDVVAVRLCGDGVK